MKIPLPCTRCQEEKGTSKVYWKDLQEDNVYQLDCEEGHKPNFRLQQNKFEILFELAMHAIVDGYYREAVVTFTSALECFYGFYINVICVKHDVSKEQFSSAWQKFAKHSERQFGAYILAHLMENKQPPSVLHKDQVEFRNNVIHKGVIPNKNEAIKYGQDVLEIIMPVLENLKSNYDKFLAIVYYQSLGLLNSRFTKEEIDYMGCVYIGTLLSASCVQDGKKLYVTEWLKNIETLHKARSSN
jgi:hypothetical protein